MHKGAGGIAIRVKMTSRTEKEARGSAGKVVSVEELSRKAAFKRLGGACDDAWNHGLVGQIASALPESKGWLTDEGVTASKALWPGRLASTRKTRWKG